MKGTASGRALSAHLKSLRTQRGLAILDVARLMNVDRSFVHQIENYGRDLRLETVRRYCDAIGAYIYIGLKEAP